jgi:hypothetical protein
VNITFTSTLTSEDEDRLAPALLSAVSGILDMFPISYRVRVETIGAHVYQITSPSLTTPEVIKLLPRKAGS